MFAAGREDVVGNRARNHFNQIAGVAALDPRHR